MSSARDRQVGGDHYKKAVQPWDIIEVYGLNYWEGNAIKYICRDKGNRQEDLQKAIHYLEYELERISLYEGGDVDDSNEASYPHCQACGLIYTRTSGEVRCPVCGVHEDYQPL